MSISYRRANLQDSSELRAICEIDATIPAMYDSEFKADEEMIRSRIKAYTEKFTEKDFFDVAVDDSGQVIGFHVVQIKPHLNNTFAGLVQTLWVSETHRGQGVARELKRRAEEWGCAHKLNHIETWVNVSNQKMIELNRDLGFEVVNYKMRKNIV